MTLFRSSCWQSVIELVLLFSISAANYYAISGETLSKSSGLTDREAQIILDYFNYYRAQVARGHLHPQPAAVDMSALEWDNDLAHRAQEWANKCGAGMFDNLEDAAQGQVYAEWSNGPTGFITYAMKEWIEVEGLKYDYLSNNYLDGHSRYTQIMTSYSVKVGCGYNSCTGKGKSRLVCNFYIGGNLPNVKPYKSGINACSECPFGRPYCMEDALCVRHDQCSRSNAHCACSIDFVKCSQHGTAKENLCHCECHAGWTGASCDVPCQDTADCSQVSTNYCFPANKYLIFMNRQCMSTCSLCKNIDMKPKVNTRGLTVNVLATKQEVLAGTTNIGGVTDDSTDDRDETCKDSNLNCPTWAQADECLTNPGYMSSFCRFSCNRCGSCVNHNTDCRFWASLGECSANSHYMHSNCRKSCKLC